MINVSDLGIVLLIMEALCDQDIISLMIESIYELGIILLRAEDLRDIFSCYEN